MDETKVHDTPTEAPIEKGKGKAADEAMDDDEDDSESGEVRRMSFHCQCFIEYRTDQHTGDRRRADRGG